MLMGFSFQKKLAKENRLDERLLGFDLSLLSEHLKIRRDKNLGLKKYRNFNESINELIEEIERGCIKK